MNYATHSTFLYSYLKIGVSNLVGLSVGSIEVDPIEKVRNIKVICLQITFSKSKTASNQNFYPMKFLINHLELHVNKLTLFSVLNKRGQLKTHPVQLF